MIFKKRNLTKLPEIYNNNKNKKSKLPRFSLIGLSIIPIFTFYLGCWQVKRLDWKLNLIEELDEKLNYEALPLPRSIDTTKLDEFEYRKVSTSGTLSADSIQVKPRIFNGETGIHLIQPLLRKGASTILINRGFLSNDKIENYLRNLKDQYVDITGMLRLSQKRNFFTPNNNPSLGEWFWVDLPAIANHFSQRLNIPIDDVLIDEIYDGLPNHHLLNGIPVGRPSKIELRNQHAIYALTWFSLSFFTTALLYRLTKRTSGLKLMNNK
ncbi:hypothetical protein E3Q22_03645 [Wallemia mellicola]|nr:hypothetical protein E3Q23_03519 [Wallemia mellicola]TIB76167.1 hypothetical protein E3Q22_03645 [Wallemia mellicola]TIB87883.1 hypothetical protein E3Q19_03482 [Wallemia mellicola]TIB95499.1 hypothetical protein E3Q18_03669 [Wallemia mellicola]TIB96894.1 hypothetical protein E3Q17_03616 [Wallemia mellicola]